MSILKRTQSDFITSHWSGGKTTQLFISPETSSFFDLNFDLRISSATVEVEESIFTLMPGYIRKLMVLEGELLIEHRGHHSLFLKPFDQDLFQGEWETRSKGEVTDFNMIYKNNVDPQLSHISVAKGDSLLLDNCVFTILYVHEGSLQLNETEFKKGEIAFIELEKRVEFLVNDNVELILVKIDDII